jgi:hypothetical protein
MSAARAMSTIVALFRPCLRKQANADLMMSSRVSVAVVYRRSRHSPQSAGARMSALVGTPVPDVTSTCSTSSSWLHEVPRT